MGYLFSSSGDGCIVEKLVDSGCMLAWLVLTTLAGSKHRKGMSSHAADLVFCVNHSSSSWWVWMGECFFWYQLTRVVPDKGPLNGRMCVVALLHSASVWIRWMFARVAEKLHVPTWWSCLYMLPVAWSFFDDNTIVMYFQLWWITSVLGYTSITLIVN